jgi:hypothetical protein
MLTSHVVIALCRSNIPHSNTITAVLLTYTYVRLVNACHFFIQIKVQWGLRPYTLRMSLTNLLIYKCLCPHPHQSRLCERPNHRAYTVKPVKWGHPWDEPKVSLIERCPHFTGQLALRTVVWDQMKCPHFTGCPHFAGLLFTGFTVFFISHSMVWARSKISSCHPPSHPDSALTQ